MDRARSLLPVQPMIMDTEVAYALVAAQTGAAQRGHELPPDWTRAMACWVNRCERCGARVVVVPDQGRWFGTALHRRCEPFRYSAIMASTVRGTA